MMIFAVIGFFFLFPVNAVNLVARQTERLALDINT